MLHCKTALIYDTARLTSLVGIFFNAASMIYFDFAKVLTPRILVVARFLMIGTYATFSLAGLVLIGF